MMTRRQLFPFVITFLAWIGLRPARVLSDRASGHWEIRRVREGDEEGLLELMRSCVAETDSLFGLCSPDQWSRQWAEGVVGERSQSLVVTLGGVIVGYMDVPSERTLAGRSGPLYRNAFWCGAAGVRTDILDPSRGAVVFRHLIHRVLSVARDLGYQRVRCAAPWLQHPCLSKPFTDYRGMTAQAFLDEEGRRRFLLEWELADAVEALEGEGAATNLNDVVS